MHEDASRRHGKTGRAVAAGLAGRGRVAALGRADWHDLAAAVRGCDAAYVVAPNFHDDEPAYVDHALAACRTAGVDRVVYHSVASPYLPEMAHHLGKAEAEHRVRRSGLAWTILQPGVYLQNFDLTGPVRVPYDVHARFGFLDLADLGRAAATVLLDDGPRRGDVRAGQPDPRASPSWRRRPAPRPSGWTQAMRRRVSGRCSPTTTSTACPPARSCCGPCSPPVAESATS